MQEMIVQWDLDNSGTISFEGFLAMISSLTSVMDIEKELHCGTFNCAHISYCSYICRTISLLEILKCLLLFSFLGIRPPCWRSLE